MSMKIKMNNKHIVLVGPMGSGKSTVGKHLQRVLNLKLVDLDFEIEKLKNQKISDMFKQYGESYFREIESEVLKTSLLDSNRSIISTGGGIVMQEQNRALIKDMAFCIYLYASVETQYKRTKYDKNRPMILVDDRKKRLSELFLVRDSLYEEISHLKIVTDNASIDDIVKYIKFKV